MGKKVKAIEGALEGQGLPLDASNMSIKIERPDYEELIKQINIISKPLASKKMTKKIYKLVKKAAKAKQLRRGVKEVGKAIRQKEKGFVVFAGDVSPLDVYSHMPVMCEDSKIPYIYVPARIDLGLASQTKRATSVVLVKDDGSYTDSFKELQATIKEIPLPI